MSERGSFCTEYIYCDKCLEVALKILIEKDKYLCSQQIDGWQNNGEKMPIISGKIGGLYQGEEIDTFETEFTKKLEEKICHPLRIAILAECGEKILNIAPTDEMLGGAIALAELLELVDKNAPSPLNIYKVAEKIKTTLTELRERLDSPELVERIAAEIRVQDIGKPSNLCAPHEYLDGSRVLAKATIKTLRGE